MSTGDQALLTAAHALAELDLLPARGAPVILKRGASPEPQPGLTVRRTRLLPPHDATIGASGVRCTALARSLLEAAADRRFSQLDRALDRSVHLRLFDGRALERVLAEHPRATGRRRLITALEQLDANTGRSRTELERRLVDLVRGSTLPAPAVNYGLGGYEVDLFWARPRLIVEADGRAYHSSPAQLVADQAREEALRQLNCRLLRFDWDAVVYRPLETIARIGAALAAEAPAPA